MSPSRLEADGADSSKAAQKELKAERERADLLAR